MCKIMKLLMRPMCEKRAGSLLKSTMLFGIDSDK